MLLFHEVSFSKLKCFIDIVAMVFFYKHVDQYCLKEI